MEMKVLIGELRMFQNYFMVKVTLVGNLVDFCTQSVNL